MEAAAHERQRHRRLVIDPLGVVDDNQYRLCAGCLLGQAQDGETDAERIERVVLRLAEHGLECGSLRLGQSVDAVEEMQRHLVHSRIPEGHLRFDADDAHDREVGCDDRHTGCQVGHRPIIAPPVSGLVRPLQFVELR